VAIKAFADHHAERNRRKVDNAYQGLLKAHPRLQGHLVKDDTWIKLVDIPSPI
jgi:hypothetical protein